MDLNKPPFSKSSLPPAAQFWFTEFHSPATGITFRVRRTLFEMRSSFQNILVLETEDFGRVLVLDGVIQLTERDEFIYHDMLSHVPLCTHRRPRRVVIVGGGDGGCLREVLRHPEVEEATLVEIDGGVVDCCREYLPSISNGAFDDPRVRLHIGDGVKFIRRHKEAFDVIIVDSTDPVAMASPLTRLGFFRAAKEALASGGVYAAQAQGPIFEGEQMRRIARTIRKAYPNASFYLGGIPTYPGGTWAFVLASRGGKSLSAISPRPLPEGVKTLYYSPEVHRASFSLPPYVQDLIQ